MKTFKFLIWWCCNMELHLKITLAIVSYFILILLSIIHFSQLAFLIIVGLSLIVVFSILSYYTFCLIKSKWAEYNQHIEND